MEAARDITFTVKSRYSCFFQKGKSVFLSPLEVLIVLNTNAGLTSFSLVCQLDANVI